MSKGKKLNKMILGILSDLTIKSVFDAPTLAEPAACQSKGSLPQKIQLTNALEVVTLEDDQFSSSTSIVWNSIAVVLCMLGSFHFN